MTNKLEDSPSIIVHVKNEFLRFTSAGIPLLGAIIVKLLLGLLLLKTFTNYLSVEEFGQLSQMMAITAFLTTIAGGAQTHGLIKNLSAAGQESESWKATLQCSHGIHYIFSIVVCGSLWVFSEQISLWLFKDQSFKIAITCVAIGVFFSGFNNLQISVLSSAKKITLLAASQSLGILSGTVFTIWLTSVYGLEGAMIGFALIGVFNALFSFIFTRKTALIRRADIFPKIDSKITSELIGYSSALVLAVSMMPGAHVFARLEIARVQDWEQVGLWQAISRISDMVIQLYGTFYNNFVLATISGMKEPIAVKRFLGILVLAVTVSAVLVYATLFLTSDFFIPLILSAEYLAIQPFLPYQFLGDIFRVVAAIGSYYYLSRNLLVRYVMLEVLAAASFLIVLMYLLSSNTLGAPLFAHMTTYAIVLGAVILMMRLPKTRYE